MLAKFVSPPQSLHPCSLVVFILQSSLSIDAGPEDQDRIPTVADCAFEFRLSTFTT